MHHLLLMGSGRAGLGQRLRLVQEALDEDTRYDPLDQAQGINATLYLTNALRKGGPVRGTVTVSGVTHIEDVMDGDAPERTSIAYLEPNTVKQLSSHYWNQTGAEDAGAVTKIFRGETLMEPYRARLEYRFLLAELFSAAQYTPDAFGDEGGMRRADTMQLWGKGDKLEITLTQFTEVADEQRHFDAEGNAKMVLLPYAKRKTDMFLADQTGRLSSPDGKPSGIHYTAIDRLYRAAKQLRIVE